MRVRRFICRWLLPVALAAAMLAAGTFVPGLLLRRQAEQLRQGASAVPVEDVRPYGDDYNDMKNALLTSIHLVENSSFGQAEYSLDDWSEVEKAVDGCQNFVNDLTMQMSDRGYWMESLLTLEYDYFGSVTDQTGQDWVLRMEGYDVSSGEYSSFLVQPQFYVPVEAQIYLMPLEYFSPQVLWDSLLETYREWCSLNFSSPQVETSFSPGTLESLDEEAFWEQWNNFGTAVEAADAEGNWSVKAVESDDIFCSFSAVSSDLTFRLQMNVTISGGQMWNIEILLREQESD